ncbi:MAG: LPS biosynthesis protein WbpP [Candidatus Marinimicrobia bacterium]|nr:LPS biosynthesis protein WbpP [Candidatus Neomarinimicrobiota bacterium]|tara:strand:+ start:19 stop:1041 length:1023 start_codon:yes stop_codon:yes gene_type:complete
MTKSYKILVTGGAGFIGSNLCEKLLKNKNKVICFDNFSTGSIENISPFIKNENFKLYKGDIRNYSDCEKVVKGVDFVFHQAALGSVPRSIKNPIDSSDVNIGGFNNILFAAINEGVRRFIYAGSSSTYGDSTVIPKKEGKIGNPLSPYAITKYTNELFADNFSKIYNIKVIGLRYFNVFGKNQNPDGAYAAVIPKFIMQLINHESPTINGNGTFSRDFTYIDNVVQANILAMITDDSKIFENGKSHEVFNIALGERTNLNELFEILKENLSRFDKSILKINPHYGVERKGDVPHSLACIDKAKNILNYNPKYNVRAGIKKSCKWYWNNLKDIIELNKRQS